MNDNDLMSMSDIARRAGVDLSTVSNWKRRFRDGENAFPSEVPNPDGGKRARFSRTEVEAWLTANSRAAETRVWNIFDALRGAIKPEQILTLISELQVRLKARPETARDLDFDAADRALPAEFRSSAGHRPWKALDPTLLGDVVGRLAAERDPAAYFDSALEAGLRRLGALTTLGEVTTPDVLADFLLSLAPAGNTLIFDPAAGRGGVVKEALRRGVAQNAMAWEINEELVNGLKMDAYLSDFDIRVEHRDALVDGAYGEPEASLVVCDPPLGLRMAPGHPASAAYWPFGTPKGQLDLAWVQLVQQHIAPGGLGMVITPLGALHRGGADADIRSALLRAGAIRAIVALPARLRQNTAIPLAVWIIGNTSDASSDVTLVDGSNFAPDELGANGPLLSALRAGLADRDAHLDATFAVRKPIPELATTTVNLLPSRWTQIPGEDKLPQDWTKTIHHAIFEAASALGPVSAEMRSIRVDPAHRAPEQWTVGRLRQQGLIEVIKGRYLPSSDDAEGPLVLNPRVFGENFDVQQHEQRLVDPLAGANLALQPGDVIVYPTATSVEARIWDRDGWIAGSHVDALRVRDRSRIDPSYLAAVLRHPRNRRHIIDSSLRAKMKIDDLSVLLPPLSEQQSYSALEEDLANRLAQLQTAMKRVGELRDAVADAATSGSVALKGIPND